MGDVDSFAAICEEIDAIHSTTQTRDETIESLVAQAETQLLDETASRSALCFLLRQVIVYHRDTGLLEAVAGLRESLPAQAMTGSDAASRSYDSALAIYFESLWDRQLRRSQAICTLPTPDAEDPPLDELLRWGLVYRWLLRAVWNDGSETALATRLSTLEQYDTAFSAVAAGTATDAQLNTVFRPTIEGRQAITVVNSHYANNRYIGNQSACLSRLEDFRTELLSQVTACLGPDVVTALTTLLAELPAGEPPRSLNRAVAGSDLPDAVKTDLQRGLAAADQEFRQYHDGECTHEPAGRSIAAGDLDTAWRAVRRKQLPIETLRQLLTTLKCKYLYPHQPSLVGSTDTTVGDGESATDGLQTAIVDWLEAAVFNSACTGNLYGSGRMNYMYDPDEWAVVLFDCLDIETDLPLTDRTGIDLFGNIPLLPCVLAVLGADVEVIDTAYATGQDAQRRVMTTTDTQHGRTGHEDGYQNTVAEFVDEMVFDPLFTERSPYPIGSDQVHPRTILEYEPFQTLKQTAISGRIRFNDLHITPDEVDPLAQFEADSFDYVLVDPPYGVGYGDSFTPRDGLAVASTAVACAARLVAPDGVIVLTCPKELPDNSRWKPVWDVRWAEQIRSVAATAGLDTSPIQVPDYETETETLESRQIVALSPT